jgi:hypothetical protein
MNGPEDLIVVARAIARRDAGALHTIRASPDLARAALPRGATRAEARPFFLVEIGHYVYAGDTLLHVAAAAYDVKIARALVVAGAEPAARNRRGAQPLHYAADGGPRSPTWNPRAQAAIVTYIVETGADPDALDDSGVAPLHRAVRTRCTGAVRALLAAGANPRLPNGNGSTPLDLASRTTGRGGSGSAEAKAEQRKIIELLSPRDHDRRHNKQVWEPRERIPEPPRLMPERPKR